MSRLKHLRIASDFFLAFPRDVALLRAALVDQGYDAEPCDVERAWQAWSRDDRGVDWHPIPPSATCAELVAILLRELEEGPPRDLDAPLQLTPARPRSARGGLSPVQAATLDAIERALADGRPAPNLKSLAEATGLGGHKLPTMREVLEELYHAGFIQRIGSRGPISVQLTYHVPPRSREVAHA